MHALILDPALSAPIGHHFNLDACLAQEFVNLGVPARIVSNWDTAPVIVEKLGVIPHFRAHPYMMHSQDRFVAPLEDYLELNQTLAADLLSLAAKVDLNDVVVVFHTVNDRMLHGIARWLAEGRLPASCRVMVILPHESGLDPQGQPIDWKALLYRHAFNALARLADGRAHLLTLSELQVRDFGLLAERPIELMPYPSCAVDWRRQHAPVDRAARPRRRVLYCGEATQRKGFHLLPEIIQRVSAARPEAEFVIQIHTWNQNDPLTSEILALAKARTNVLTVSGFTLPHDFYALLDDADVVLQPYQALVYQQGTSAIFEEAMYLGRPCVVTPRTMMAAAIGQNPGAGAVAIDYSAAALADAVIAVLSDFPRFDLGAERASAVWRARDGIDRFAAFLVDRARRR